MRLDKVLVRKYRSIDRQAEFDVSDFTVLVGGNNEGKSNLLRAAVLAMHAIEEWAKLPSDGPINDVPSHFLLNRRTSLQRFSDHQN